jgi:hypothetical protein
MSHFVVSGGMKILHKAGKGETWLSVGVLVVLLAIGSGIWWQQYRLSPAVIAFRPAVQVSGTSAAHRAGLIDTLPPGLIPLTPVERFNPETLYEKIDGQAELYLSAGFVGLACQRFRGSDDADFWLEAFVYDMGNDLNAFAVFSSQRREDALPVEGLPTAYRTENALFVAHGPYYIEIIASVPSELAVETMHAIAVNLTAGRPAARPTGMGLEWFPPAALEPQSLAVIPADAFGLERFDRVMTVRYVLDGNAVTAFVSKRDTPQDARTLADAFQSLLLKYGGRALDPGPGLAEARMVEIMDTFDVVFTIGPFVAGVHEAQDRSTAEDLARRMVQTLKGVVREP